MENDKTIKCVYFVVDDPKWNIIYERSHTSILDKILDFYQARNNFSLKSLFNRIFSLFKIGVDTKSVTGSPNWIQTKTRFVPGLKYKKYESRSCRMVQNIYKLEVLLPELECVT